MAAGNGEAQQSSRLREGIVEPDGLLPALPAVQVTPEGLSWVSHGRDLGPAQWRQLPLGRNIPARADEWVRLLDETGHLVALATTDRTGAVLHPSVVLI